MNLTTERLKKLIREELEKIMEDDYVAGYADSGLPYTMKSVGKDVQNFLDGLPEQDDPIKKNAERQLMIAYNETRDPQQFKADAHQILTDMIKKVKVRGSDNVAAQKEIDMLFGDGKKTEMAEGFFDRLGAKAQGVMSQMKSGPKPDSAHMQNLSYVAKAHKRVLDSIEKLKTDIMNDAKKLGIDKNKSLSQDVEEMTSILSDAQKEIKNISNRIIAKNRTK